MAVLKSFELFFDLPSELREQVLGYLLVKPTAIQIKQDSDQSTRSSFTACQQSLSSSSDEDEDEEDEEDEDAPDGPRWPINYFLVSQVFNREATATYFYGNVFHIFLKGTKVALNHPENSRAQLNNPRSPPLHFKDPRSGDALLLNPAWTPSVRRLRAVVVYVPRLRGFLEQAVFQPLLDMILAGGLKHLEFRIGVRSRGESMFSAWPMRCMYRVLTDPDLRVARLSIPARSHEAVWCAFHASGGGDGRERCAVSKGRVEGPQSGWLGVDVAALIQRYGEVDDHFRILKVGD